MSPDDVKIRANVVSVVGDRATVDLFLEWGVLGDVWLNRVDVRLPSDAA